MPRYIDSEILWQKLHEVGGCGAEKGTWAAGWDQAIDEAIMLLDKMPTADVVEVVRCLRGWRGVRTMSKCERCVHFPICEWCAENPEFKFPNSDNIQCAMLNTDFDDLEEEISIALRLAKQQWEEAREDTIDPSKSAFFKGRWSALKDVLNLMASKGHLVQEAERALAERNGSHE